ncbi:MAG TPA: tol-pal system protein YbgF [Candidatus Acidoferrales bacterium]|nr:tol-pal system protein YbgF [Candidatus Acidoferrales bacterium]
MALVVLLVGALGGAILTPPPAGAVSKEIIQLQQQVAQLLQGQQDLRSALDQKDAELKTLLEQSLDSVSKLNSSMSTLEKNVLDVQANSGSRIDTLATQTQGISDNLQDVQARVGKLSQQMTDIQGVLQTIDAKVSGGAPAGGAASPSSNPDNSAAPPMNQPAGSAPAPSADVLYTSALRDYSGGKYDLARQEFTDYLRYFPTTDLASNAQFYIGEIDYVQADFTGAIAQYDKVILNYPKSFKQGAARLKKGEALLETGQRAAALREFREVVRRYPGSDEAKRAQAKLRELGSARTPSR